MLLTSAAPAAAYAPLRHSVFRLLWVATLPSNIGLWIQNTGAGWLMTSLAPSPVMVSLVQAASMLPVFLFALPGGVLAAILDRRLTLLAALGWALVADLLLAGLAVMCWLGELWAKVGDGLTGGRRRIVGVFEPPRLQPRSDTPCPMLAWSS